MTDESDERYKALIQRWEIARKLIEHEDNLQDQRISALLTLQGFLFAGFALIAVNIADKDRAEYRCSLTILLMVLAVVGFFSPVLFYRPLLAAMRQVEAAKEWWLAFLKRNLPCAADISGPSGITSEQQRGYAFPPIIGIKAKTFPLFCNKNTYKDAFRDIDFGYIDSAIQENKPGMFDGFLCLVMPLCLVWALLFSASGVSLIKQRPCPEAGGDDKPAEVAKIWQPVLDRMSKLLDRVEVVIERTPPAPAVPSIVVSPVISGPVQECCCKAEDVKVKKPPSRPNNPCPPSGSERPLR